MQKLTGGTGRKIFFTGILAALLLGLIGSCSIRSYRTVRIQRMDALAQPYFDEALRNVPKVVRQLTASKTLCRICWYLARDKLTGANSTEVFLSDVLKKPITEPCQKGALAYGCGFDSKGALLALKDIHTDDSITRAYAISGLAMEALFLKAAVSSLRSVLHATTGRLTAVCGSGTACALADGPFPVGDAVGIVLAAGGTVWCCFDLYQARKHLPAELTAMLQQSIRDCQAACRMEALK